MSRTEKIWNVLVMAGVTQGAAPAALKTESPWYIKSLMAFSGWIAALLMLVFLALSGLIDADGHVQTLIIGLMMCGAAYAVLRSPRNEFLSHLGVTLSLTGQGLIGFFMFQSSGLHDVLIVWLVVLLQVMSALVIPNFVHRVISTFAGAFAFEIALTLSGFSFLSTGIVMFLAAWCWLNEFRDPHQMKKIQAIGYGLVLALILIKKTTSFGYSSLAWLFQQYEPVFSVSQWVGQVLVGAAALYAVWRLLQRYGQRMSDRVSIAALVGTLLICMASVEVRGIAAGMMIILFGFVGSNRVLLGLGVASLLFHAWSYYYFLDVTLITKSQTLLIVSLVLFSARWLMVTMFPMKKAVVHV